ncbi:hypothetical protein ILUMI_10894 [Ignelater luminosus]|uniref:Carboxylesterase type B domain-containing protein n=1 Tax=Ignelater luminosus TaxID=2038154 RepID=A0A8K0CX02_IGNLU|nr:hypothetical protein ILUMI_10894 [Ignelater luminosus]
MCKPEYRKHQPSFAAVISASDPEPIEKWTTTVQADKTYVCAQYTFLKQTNDVIGDEDCLYLYVYVPKETITGNEDLDVVVHIHGGAFTVGDPASNAGPEYVMDRDLIFVTMNFRMGILGFLSTQDQTLPGNYGLKDQVMAMKWVKDNIKYFGGNPNSITLTGFASGAAAVHLHYLSPLSTGLFNRGFSQSGSSLNPWSLSKKSIQRARKLGTILGCKETSKELAECLRRASVRSLVGAHASFTELDNTVPPGAFGPVIEFGPKGFLPDHPYKLMLEGRINDYPWVASNVKDEGISPAGFLLLHDQLQKLGNEWDELAPTALIFNDTAFDHDKKGIAKAIRSYYLKDEGLSKNNIDKLIKLFTDRYYQLDVIKAAFLQSTVTKSPVYYYFFDYHIDMPVAFKANLSVVGHSDDARLLYKFADNPKVLSDTDHKMKTIFIDFLYRYASTGKPDFKGIPWRPFYTVNQPVSFMHVSSPTLIFENRVLNLEPFGFWHSLPLNENEHLFPYLLNIIQFLHNVKKNSFIDLLLVIFHPPLNTLEWFINLLMTKIYLLRFSLDFLQSTSIGDEDCLYLYVYVPREKINTNEKLDVVVHIHGGAFIIGDPKSLSGPDYIMDRDLIYFREIDGLKDQSLALKWVKENIQYFGGNPDSVALTGMSAGAACVHFHYFSPLSEGLFHRGHSQSGTALNPLKKAQKLGIMLGCSTDTEELVQCLRKFSGKLITEAFGDFLDYSGMLPSNAFAPVIEPNHTKAFLKEHPYKLLMDDNEIFDFQLFLVFVLLHKLPELEKQWNEVLPYTLAYYDTADENDKPSIGKAVKNYYMNNEPISMNNVLNLTKVMVGVAEFENVEWKPVSSNEEVDYMHISSPNDIRAEHAKEIGLASFWNSLPLKENAHLFN